VIVSNPAGSVTSSNAVLTIIIPAGYNQISATASGGKAVLSRPVC